MIEIVLPVYSRFKSWAEEFDTADLKKKKMIACQFFDRVELGKDYKIIIYMNVTYKQLYSEVDMAQYSPLAVSVISKVMISR